MSGWSSGVGAGIAAPLVASSNRGVVETFYFYHVLKAYSTRSYCAKLISPVFSKYFRYSICIILLLVADKKPKVWIGRFGGLFL